MSSEKNISQIRVTNWNHFNFYCNTTCLYSWQKMSQLMTKPTKWLCAKQRLRSAWASAQSDQSLPCLQEESLGVLSYPLNAQRRLIRLGGLPDWSESSLGAHSFCWFCHVTAQMTMVYFCNKSLSKCMSLQKRLHVGLVISVKTCNYIKNFLLLFDLSFTFLKKINIKFLEINIK